MQKEPTRESDAALVNAVVLNAELPAQVFARRFEQYLFFDADVTSSRPLIAAVRTVALTCFGQDLDIEVFAQSTRSFLARLDGNADWPGEINMLGKALRDEGDFNGIVLVDAKKRWVAYQRRPVDMGVLAVDCNRALGEIEAVRDSFFDSHDVSGWLSQRTPRDIDLVNSFGTDFLTNLLKNYLNP